MRIEWNNGQCSQIIFHNKWSRCHITIFRVTFVKSQEVNINLWKVSGSNSMRTQMMSTMTASFRFSFPLFFSFSLFLPTLFKLTGRQSLKVVKNMDFFLSDYFKFLFPYTLTIDPVHIIGSPCISICKMGLIIIPACMGFVWRLYYRMHAKCLK